VNANKGNTKVTALDTFQARRKVSDAILASEAESMVVFLFKILIV
jgi:hypothetical protein